MWMIFYLWESNLLETLAINSVLLHPSIEKDLAYLGRVKHNI